MEKASSSPFLPDFPYRVICESVNSGSEASKLPKSE